MTCFATCCGDVEPIENGCQKKNTITLIAMMIGTTIERLLVGL